MKKVLLFITVLFSSISFSQENIDLFIWAGQSNALGRQGDAAGYPADTDNQDNQIRFNWTVANGSNSGGWTTMQPQTGYFAAGHFGPEVTFSRNLLAEYNNPAIFKFTQGATSIFEHWQGPGDGGLYDNMVTGLNTAITQLENQGHTVNIRGLIWIQGESDSNSQAAATAYFNNLTTILNDLRNNVVNIADLPIILGVDEQYFNLDDHEQPEILNAHQNIAFNDDNIKFTSMYGYPKADATHLTPAGLISHGEDLFDAFQLLVFGENPLEACTISSSGEEESFERSSWGQTFKTDCSGNLSSILFNAVNLHNHNATFTIHNGTDCSGSIIYSQQLNSILAGENEILIDTELYLNKEHTYFFQIVTDDDSIWSINYSNTDTVFGSLKTIPNEGGSYCGRDFPNFDMDFSVELLAPSEDCTLSSSGTVVSYERASWGQSFKTDCSGELSSITFSASNEHNHNATFTIYDGENCNENVLFTQQLNSIVAGDNEVNIDGAITLNAANTYFFQVVTDDDSFWRINYSNTSNVFGNLKTFLDGSYCGRDFPSFDMNFSVEILSDNTCANDSNIYSFTYDNRTYEIVKENKTWINAATCAVERGGILAEINSQEEQDAIYNELANNADIDVLNTVSPDGGNASYVWIGANDLALEGQWIWDGDNDTNGDNFWQGGSVANGGTPINGLYSNWGNEPDNSGNAQDAAGIAITQWPVTSGSLGSAGQWNDIDHTNSLYYIIEYDSNLGVNNTEIEKVKVYPNPVKDILTIESINNITDIRIINSLGQVVNSVSLDSSDKLNIDFSNYNKGVYFVTIRLENGEFITKKIMK